MTKYINDYSKVENEETQTTYHSFNVTVRGNIWSVGVQTGKYNGITVRKVSNNPFGTVGKFFETWDDVFSHYGSEMSNMLDDVKFSFDMMTLPKN